MLAWSVTQLNQHAKNLLEGDRRLREVFVQGEITGLSHGPKGHLYLTLSDGQASVKAVMFAERVAALASVPEVGMQAMTRGSVGLYEKNGSFRLAITDMIPTGHGAQASAAAQVKERFEQEGLLQPAYRKPLPLFPACIGVVTSPRGAALQDVLDTVERRWPVVKILVFAATVQGEGAVASITTALLRADAHPETQAILLVRGGGPAEDLSPFEDESLARRVFACRNPVVTGIGHETDRSLCDLVADARAATPTQAAQFAVPDAAEVQRQLTSGHQALRNAMQRQLSSYEQRLARVDTRQFSAQYKNRLDKNRQMLESLIQSMLTLTEHRLWRQEQALSSAAALLQSVSPLATLGRGYALVLRQGQVVKSAYQLKPGQELELRFADGTAKATILDL